MKNSIDLTQTKETTSSPKTFSIKKNFPDIGELEYKIASTKVEVEGAMALVYKEYLKRGYISSDYYKNKLRVTLHHILPTTTIFVVLKDNEVIATTVLIPDSPLGLPMDMGFKKVANQLRVNDRRICESGHLAIKSDIFGSGCFSMFNLSKLNFIFTLFKLVFQYVAFYEKFDDICIVTNPKYMIFKFLPFEVFGETKYYGYDVMNIKKKAAVPKKFDLRNMRNLVKNRKANPLASLPYKSIIFKMMVGKSKIPFELMARKYQFTVTDLKEYFVLKSNVLKKSNKSHHSYICNCYNLSKDDLEKLLKH
jgi:hypothetical protein